MCDHPSRCDHDHFAIPEPLKCPDCHGQGEALAPCRTPGHGHRCDCGSPGLSECDRCKGTGRKLCTWWLDGLGRECGEPAYHSVHEGELENGEEHLLCEEHRPVWQRAALAMDVEHRARLASAEGARL